MNIDSLRATGVDKRLASLFERGFSGRRIAQEIGVPAPTVARWLFALGLQRDRCDAMRLPERRVHPRTTRSCVECGDAFEGTRRAKVCSKACRRTRNNAFARQHRAESAPPTPRPRLARPTARPTLSVAKRELMILARADRGDTVEDIAASLQLTPSRVRAVIRDACEAQT